MVLANPIWLALIALMPIAWLVLRRKGYVGYSDTRLVSQVKGWAMHRIPLILLSLAFVCFVVALARPQHMRMATAQTVQSRDIVVAVDISGSMSAQFAGQLPQPTPNAELDKELPPMPVPVAIGQTGQSNNQQTDNGPASQTRLVAAQYAVLDFVRLRYAADAGDRIGIMEFDTQQYWLWPLSLDLKTVYRKGQFLRYANGGGTNFGSKPGPIDAASKMFDELGQSKTKVLIMVTDGEDYISGTDMDRLLKLMRDQGIHLYVIGVGFGDNGGTTDLEDLAHQVGGKVCRVDDANQLDGCFKNISQLERSIIAVQTTQEPDELFFYFGWAALILFLLGCCGEALILNQ